MNRFWFAKSGVGPGHYSVGTADREVVSIVAKDDATARLCAEAAAEAMNRPAVWADLERQADAREG